MSAENKSDSAIDQSQAEIQQAGLTEKGATYPQIFQKSVDDFQSGYGDGFNSPEGQAKFDEGKNQIAQLLLEVAGRGAILAFPENANYLSDYAVNLSATIGKYLGELNAIKTLEVKSDEATGKIKELEAMDAATAILSLNNNEAAAGKLQGIIGKAGENIQVLGELVKSLNGNKKLPESLVSRMSGEVEKSLLKIEKTKIAAETALLAQKYSNYLKFSLTLEPYLKVKIDLNPKLKMIKAADLEQMTDEEKAKHQPYLAAKDYEKMIAELAMPAMLVAEEVEMATAPKFLESFWAGKKLFELGMTTEAEASLEHFLKIDLKSAEWENHPEVAGKRNLCEVLANQMMDKIKENSNQNKEFLIAQTELGGGNIYSAKLHLKAYLEAANRTPEEERSKYSFLNSAKDLLKNIALTQIRQVRDRMEVNKPDRYVVNSSDDFRQDARIDNPAYQKFERYELILKNIENAVAAGEVLDFNEALKNLPADQAAEIADPQKFNFFGNEILENNAEEKEADPDKRGLKDRKETWLQLAQKYRAEGNYQMAEEYFNKYFSKEFGKMAQNREVTIDTLWAENSKHPRILNNINENVEKSKVEWDKQAAENGPEWVAKNPWNRAKVYDAYRKESMNRLMPMALQKAQQRKFMADPNSLPVNDQGAWKQFADMKGVHGTDKWYEPLALSDEEADQYTRELPIQIGIIAVSGALSGGAGGAVAAGIMRRGAIGAVELAGEEILDWGVASGGRRLAAWAGGLVVENTLFTASSTVLNALRSGQIGSSEQLAEEWAKGLLTLGGLGMVGRATHALEFGKLTAFGTEIAGMPNLDIAGVGLTRGEFERPDMLHTFAMVLGLKTGHEFPRLIKVALGKVASKLLGARKVSITVERDHSSNDGQENAKETHRQSRFSNDRSEGIADTAGAEITEEGVIVLHLDAINKVLKTGYKATEKGIVSEQGEVMSLKQYLEKFAGDPEAKALLDLVRQLKTHEVHHRVLEVLKNEKIGDSTLQAELIKMVTENPELAKLVGEPINFEKIQELISELQDGSSKHSNVSTESRQQVQKTLENLFKQLGYKYTEKSSISIRKIDTDLLNKKKAEDFRRDKAAASDMPAAQIDRSAGKSSPKAVPATNENKLPEVKSFYRKGETVEIMSEDGKTTREVTIEGFDPNTGEVIISELQGDLWLGAKPLKNMEELVAKAKEARQSREAKNNQAQAPKVDNTSGHERNDTKQSREKVPRQTEVMSVGDLHGNADILLKNLKALGLINEDANLNDPNSIRWIGGKSKLVFHGDILADRAEGSFQAMEIIKKLQKAAEASGGKVELIAGNHEDFAFAFLCNLLTADRRSVDAYATVGDQAVGLLEFIKRYGPPELKNITSMQEYYNSTVVGMKGDANIRQQILTRMRTEPEGRALLKQMCEMKLAEYIDDTLYIHTELTPGIIAMIDKNGMSVGQAVDQINRDYQAGMRATLLGEGSVDMAKFDAIRKTFLDTMKNRDYEHTRGQLSGLNNKGVNRIIHGHTHSDQGSNVRPTSDGVEIVGVDFSAGKDSTWTDDPTRSVGKTGLDGKMQFGTDVEKPSVVSNNAPAQASSVQANAARVENQQPVALDSNTGSKPIASGDEVWIDGRKLYVQFVADDYVTLGFLHPSQAKGKAQLFERVRLSKVLAERDKTAAQKPTDSTEKPNGMEAPSMRVGQKVNIVKSDGSTIYENWRIDEIRPDGTIVVIDGLKERTFSSQRELEEEIKLAAQLGQVLKKPFSISYESGGSIQTETYTGRSYDRANGRIEMVDNYGRVWRPTIEELFARIESSKINEGKRAAQLEAQKNLNSLSAIAQTPYIPSSEIGKANPRALTGDAALQWRVYDALSGKVSNDPAQRNLENMLKRMAETDPERINLLSANIPTLSQSVLDAICIGEKITMPAIEGGKVYKFFKTGGTLGKGVQGRVEKVLVFSPPSAELSIGAVKTLLNSQNSYGQKDVEAGRRNREINHPGLNKVLAVSPEYMLMESGIDAMPVATPGGFLGFGGETPRENLNLLRDWVRTYREVFEANGLLHGDNHLGNTITYKNAQGKRVVQIIDTDLTRADSRSEWEATFLSRRDYNGLLDGIRVTAESQKGNFPAGTFDKLIQMSEDLKKVATDLNSTVPQPDFLRRFWAIHAELERICANINNN